MPSTRELASALRVSRATVATAYDQLVAEGYLAGQRGSGTFVCHELPDRPLARLKPDDRRAAGGESHISAFAKRLGPVGMRAAMPPGTIDLSALDPDWTLFPFPVWNRLLRRHLRRMHSSVHRHTAGAAGHDALRDTIASYLARSRAVRCQAEQIVIVNGSQQALDFCARVLVDVGDRVAIEEPGYQGARQLFAAVGATVYPVPVDADGLLVGSIPSSVRLAHVTPSHQFPTGVSLSLARRLELLAWARSQSAFVIEDDYDSEFRYDGAPLPSLQGLGDASRIVYTGTFSLAMFPGLRIGYVVLPEPLVEPFLRVKWYSDRQTAYLEQAALADFIREGHLERHIRRMRRVYKRRREALLDALARYCGDRASIAGDPAGLHVVVRFDRPDMAARAERCGVGLASTRSCYAGSAPGNEFILRFAGLTERTLSEAIRRLA